MKARPNSPTHLIMILLLLSPMLLTFSGGNTSEVVWRVVHNIREGVARPRSVGVGQNGELFYLSIIIEITNGCCLKLNMLMFHYCCLVAASLIIFLSFTLLFTVHLMNNFGLLRKCVLYYDPTVECQTLEYSNLQQYLFVLMIFWIRLNEERL